MRELLPDLDPSEWPVFQEVTKDAVYLLTKRRAVDLCRVATCLCPLA